MTRSPEILLIEDDFDLADAIVEVLQTEDYRVSYEPNGRAALDRLAKDQLPDLILLDLMMPKMNGWEFRTAQLSDRRLARIPVIVLSATGERSRPIDAKMVLRKPVSIEELLSAVGKFLR